MTTSAPVAPPPPTQSQQLPGVPALNDPTALAKRQQSHPAFHQQQAPEVAQGPGSLPPATPAPVAPAPAPAPAPVAPAPVAPAPVAPTAVTDTAPQQINIIPDTNLLAAVAPPELKYVQAPAAAPQVDPVIKGLQDQLAALTQERTAAEVAARRQQLLNPTIDFSAVGDIDADQAQALNDNLVRPQLAGIVDHFEAQLNAQKEFYDTQLNQLQGVGTQVDQVQQQQQISDAARWRTTNASVQAANPNFEAELNDPAFIAAAGPRYDDILQAYHSHDAAHVNSTMAYVRSQLAAPVTGVEGQAQAGTATASTSPAPAQEQGVVKQSDISRNIEDFQQRRITREQYMENVKRFQAASNAGLVVAG